ncbi:hypothetical protein [Mobiluncus mulieris]|nr:hypothetical protein [Mobiluncus mulieris]
MYAMKNDSDGIVPGERINDGKFQLHCVRAAKEYGDVMEALNELVEVGMAQLDTEGEQVKELRLNWAFQTTAQYRQDKREGNRKKMAAYRAQKEPRQEGDPSEPNPQPGEGVTPMSPVSNAGVTRYTEVSNAGVTLVSPVSNADVTRYTEVSNGDVTLVSPVSNAGVSCSSSCSSSCSEDVGTATGTASLNPGESNGGLGSWHPDSKLQGQLTKRYGIDYATFERAFKEYLVSCSPQDQQAAASDLDCSFESWLREQAKAIEWWLGEFLPNVIKLECVEGLAQWWPKPSHLDIAKSKNLDFNKVLKSWITHKVLETGEPPNHPDMAFTSYLNACKPKVAA